MSKNHSTNRERSLIARKKNRKRKFLDSEMARWIYKKKEAWRKYWRGETMKPVFVE